MLRIFILLGLCLMLIFSTAGKANALNLGINTQNIHSTGIYLGGSVVRDYNHPLSGFQMHNVAFDVGWSWEIYKVEVDLVPIKANLGTENNFKFGVVVRKYFK